MKDVLEHPDKNWNWNCLSSNPSITMKDVLEHPDKHWNWYGLSMKPKYHNERYSGTF